MTSSRRTAKDKGTRFETGMERYLRWALDDQRIHRLRLHGNKDIGDIGNVFFMGDPVTIECKSTKRFNATQHLREAVVEAGNADSPYPWVLQKRDRVGLTSLKGLGDQWAYTSEDVLDTMCERLDEETMLRVRLDAQRIGRGRNIVCITVRQFALLLNHGQPLGPDQS